MIQRLVEEAGLKDGGYGLILPMSGSEPDSSVFYAKKQFTSLGLDNIYGLNFERGQNPDTKRVDSIRSANMIYISGGDQSRFMDIVHDTSIEEAIEDAYQNGCIIAGTSAGAAVMSEKMITGNELRHPDYHPTFRHIETDNIEIIEGMGLLTKAIIDQHFIKRSRYNRLITAVIDYPELLGIGIDEATAILVYRDSAEVVGDSQVVLVANLSNHKSTAGIKMGARALRLDVLLPGDKFALRKGSLNGIK